MLGALHMAVWKDRPFLEALCLYTSQWYEVQGRVIEVSLFH